MAALYEKVLNWTLNHKLVTSLISVALLVGSLFLIPVIGVSFLPDEEQKMMYITYTPEPGETLATVNEEVEKGEEYLLNLDKMSKPCKYLSAVKTRCHLVHRMVHLMFVTFDSDTEEFTKVTEDTIEGT